MAGNDRCAAIVPLLTRLLGQRVKGCHWLA